MAVTPFVAEKTATVQMLVNALKVKGYSESNIARNRFSNRFGRILGGKTTWIPDIFLISRTMGTLAADVQLLESGEGQFIPETVEKAAMTFCKPRCRIKMALFVPIGAVFSPPEIIKAARLGLSIKAFDKHANIYSILDRSISRLPSITANETASIRDQINSGWIIPNVLVNQLSTLRTVQYAASLRAFAQSCAELPRPITLERQYDLAAECIQGILNEAQLVNCCSSIRVEQGLENIARIGGAARDHFLHQFQTFLMGALIIEKYNSPGQTPFHLSTSCPRIDIPWLLASIFHDYGSTISDIESCINTGIGKFSFKPSTNLASSTFLNSFYEYSVNQADPDNWDPETFIANSTEMQRILFSAVAAVSGSRYGIKPNHGVLSSYKILELAKVLLDERPHLKPVFYSSALSASMHDKALWYDFFVNDVFPLDARKFPLTYLLILCDTIAEVGRPKTTETSLMDALVKFDVNGSNVNYSVWFRKADRGYLMKFWSKFVNEFCFVNPILTLNCKCVGGEIE